MEVVSYCVTECVCACACTQLVVYAGKWIINKWLLIAQELRASARVVMDNGAMYFCRSVCIEDGYINSIVARPVVYTV